MLIISKAFQISNAHFSWFLGVSAKLKKWILNQDTEEKSHLQAGHFAGNWSLNNYFFVKELKKKTVMQDLWEKKRKTHELSDSPKLCLSAPLLSIPRRGKCTKLDTKGCWIHYMLSDKHTKGNAHILTNFFQF